MSGRYTLYGRHGGGSIAVQFLLETFGIAHDIVWVTHEEAAQPEYKRINPTGKIPALVLPDGATILELAAICLHLTNGRGFVLRSRCPSTKWRWISPTSAS